MIKLPAAARRLTRRSIGMSRAQPIAPEALHDLAQREEVLVIGVGLVRPGTQDPRLPGEQRVAVHFLADLQQTAFAAQDQAQRMMVGVIVVFSAHDEGVRQRHTAEIEDFLIVRAAARAAVERRAV